jgi:uncharacterized protein
MARARRHWIFDVQDSMFGVPRSILLFAIRTYQWTISPALTLFFGPAGGCRFTPTCSQYVLDAVREHGALAGAALTARRICRCHPLGGCGYDPVPERKPFGALKREALKRIHPAPRFNASTLRRFNV